MFSILCRFKALSSKGLKGYLLAIALLSTSAVLTQPILAQPDPIPVPEADSGPVPLPAPAPAPEAQPIPPGPLLDPDSVERPVFSATDISTRLAELALGYAQAQKSSKAVALLEKAEIYPEEGSCFEAIPLLRIGVAYWAVGERERGEALIEQSAQLAEVRAAENCALSATGPTESFHNRAVEYAEAGYLDMGLQLMYRVDDVFRTLKLVEVAVAFAKAGRQSEAEEIINRAIAEEQQKLKQYTQAPEETPPLSAIAARLWAIAAEQLVEAQQPELALSVINQIEQSADPSFIEPTRELTEVESSRMMEAQFQREIFLARLLAEIEQPQRAIQRLDAAIQLLDPPLEDSSNWLKAAALYSELDSPKATELFRRFESRLLELPNDQKVATQANLIESYGSIGELDKALAIFEQMDSTTRAAKWAIVQGYAKAGQAQAAYAFVEANINQLTRSNLMRFHLQEGQYAEAANIAQRPDMLGFLPEVAWAYCEAGQPEPVIPLIAKISDGPNPDELGPPARASRDRMRLCAAVAFAKKGDFDRALDLANEIEDIEYRTETLSDIGVQQARTDSAAEAVKTLDKALSLLTEATGETLTGETL